jgi:hypothetical protein
MLKLVSCLTLPVMVLSVACLDSSKKTESKRQVPKPQSGSEQTATGANNENLDCDAQWVLATRQQPKGAQFVYDTSLTASIFTDRFDRNVIISSSSPDAISQTITVTSQLIQQFSSSLKQQTVTLQKSKFLQGCQKEIPQPIAIATLGGQFIVKGKSNEALVLQGNSVPAQRYDMQLNNVSYSGYQISADVQLWVSSKYPALPLKQTMTITDSPKLDIIKGARFVDILKSPLPSAQ